MADDTWFGIDRVARPLVLAGIVLGFGLGGFFDGIVFHQILQTHSMATAHPDPAIAEDMELQVLLDGIFHLVTYLLTIVGVILVWRASQISAVSLSGQTLLGAALIGWGLFNLVEGTINHHILQLHHVWPDGPGGRLVWDSGFLVWGAVMVGVGAYLVRSDSAVQPEQTTDQRQEVEQTNEPP